MHQSSVHTKHLIEKKRGQKGEFKLPHMMAKMQVCVVVLIGGVLHVPKNSLCELAKVSVHTHTQHQPSHHLLTKYDSFPFKDGKILRKTRLNYRESNALLLFH